MQPQIPKLPPLRLSKTGKVLLAIAIASLAAIPLLPIIKSAVTAPSIVDTGMPCDSVWPAQASMVLVTTDLGGGTTVSRPAMALPDQPRVIYLCTSRSQQ